MAPYLLLRWRYPITQSYCAKMGTLEQVGKQRHRVQMPAQATAGPVLLCASVSLHLTCYRLGPCEVFRNSEATISAPTETSPLMGLGWWECTLSSTAESQFPGVPTFAM